MGASDVLLRLKVQRDANAKSVLAETQREIERLTAATGRLTQASQATASATRQVSATASQAVEAHRRVRTAAEQAAEVSRLLPDSLKRSAGETAVAAQEAARALTEGLRREFALSQADTKEALARGLITEEEARTRGAAAGKAFNDGVLNLIQQQGTAGGLSGQSGQTLFVGLTNQLKSVDVAASRASLGGLKSLSRGFATIATQQLAFRSGLGSIISTLGFLSIGAALTLGVTAGLAAIAFGIRKIREAAAEAEAPVRALRDRVEELRRARLEQFQTLGDQVDAETQLTNQQEELARIQRELRDARRGLSFATDQPGEQASAQAEINRLVKEEIAAKAELEAREGRLNAIRRQAGVEAKQTRAGEIGDLAALIDAGVATQAQLQRRATLLRDLEAELAASRREEAGNTEQIKIRTAKQAELVGQINTLREAGVKKTKEQKELDRERLDLALAELQVRSTQTQAGVARGDLTAREGLLEELGILQERQRLLVAALPLAEAQARALGSKEARAGVASMRQELEATKLEIAQVTARTNEWREALRELQIDEAIADADPVEAFRLQFDRSFGPLQAAAEDAGDKVGIVFLNAMFSRGITDAQAEKVLGGLEEDLAAMARRREGIQLDLELGRISRPEALERTVQLLEEQRDRLRETLPDLREMAETLGSPALRAELENRELQLAEIDLQIHRLRDTTAEWREQIERIGTSAFAGFLEDLVIQSKTVTEAFRDMARAIVQEIARIIARALAARVALAAAGLLTAGAASAAAGVPALAAGFASGGLIRGPGTGTSDSIPAWLSHGEYVIRAARVRIPEIRHLLDQINFGPINALPPIRTRARSGYAEGGMVERPPLATRTALDGRLDIGLDDGLVLRSLESNEALRALLRLVGNNRRAFQRVLG